MSFIKTNNLKKNIHELQNKKILCIGDIILDNFVDSNLIKISEEDPVNVIKKKSDNFILGGVGNVALNLKNIGINVDLVCLGSKDQNYNILRKLLKKEELKSKIFFEDSRITTVKERYYIDKYHLIRKDLEDTRPISDNFSNRILDYVKKLILKKDYDLILVSDYGKGLISNYFFKKLSNYCNLKKIKIITDPKSKNLEKYNGSFIIKANKKEINSYLEKFNLNIDILDSKNKKLKKQLLNKLKILKIKNFIITRSKNSTLYFENKRNAKIYAFPVNNLSIVNTTGAGDTFISFFSAFYLLKNNFNDSINLANIFSEYSVNKFGTYAPSFYEIILKNLKLKKYYFSKDQTFLSKIIEDIKKINISIGFTNGCFDVLHAGHIKLLKEARQKCDFLVVGLNGDSSVKSNKGKGRPINDTESRLEIISSLDCVDLVCVFDEKTPLKLIKFIQPKILFKGSDYKSNDVVGNNLVKKYGGKVIIITKLRNYSSTKIIENFNN